MSRKILFIAPHRPDRAPSQRFRFEQYLDFLKDNGYDYDFSYLVPQKEDKMFYGPGNTMKKSFFLMRKAGKRFRDIFRAGRYDLIFIQREAYFLGPAFFEYWFSKSKAKVVFDFDDSIWIPNVSAANKKFEWLKDYKKTSRIIRYSDMIFAGNQYLHDYASSFNENIRIVPTTIDTEEYQRMDVTKADDRIIIGWSGSITTIQHFKVALPFLYKVYEKYGDKIAFKVIGDGNFAEENLKIHGLPWIKEDELKELSSFDIGIMPLPDDKWAKGKCGLKGLQYMALGIPTIMSPVGVNTEIIKDGENGFLASEENEWVEKISRLIEDADLRKKLGEESRKTVVEQYSFEAQKNNYLKFFDELLSN